MGTLLERGMMLLRLNQQGMMVIMMEGRRNEERSAIVEDKTWLL